jgi:hypothetical protein
MPNTLFALAVLIILVMPGIVFAIQVDNRRPTRDLSSLRELTIITGVGVICDAVVLAIFGIIRALFPEDTPDVGRIERQGSAYVKLHFVSVGWWFLALFLTSCALAYALGRFKPEIAGKVASGKIAFNSAWWEAFHALPETYKYVGCYLHDGTYISGYLATYSTESDETSDRDLALSAPISYRGPNSGDQDLPMDNVGIVIVSAGQLKFLTVTHVPFHPNMSTGNPSPVSSRGRPWLAPLKRRSQRAASGIIHIVKKGISVIGRIAKRGASTFRSVNLGCGADRWNRQERDVVCWVPLCSPRAGS